MTLSTRTSADIVSSVRLVAEAALDRKAIGLKIFHLEPVTDFTDYFIVLSGATDRQVRALADGIQGTLRDHKVKPLHVEGLRNAQWVLLDYGDFVVHVFDEDRRAFYGLERLWADAPEVTEELSP